jgi:hypothetical protein
MCDIALGMQEAGLLAFAERVNAFHMGQWVEQGLRDEDEDSWGRAFQQALSLTLARGGRFHFDLTGLDIAEALRRSRTVGGPLYGVGTSTDRSETCLVY